MPRFEGDGDTVVAAHIMHVSWAARPLPAPSLLPSNCRAPVGALAWSADRCERVTKSVGGGDRRTIGSWTGRRWRGFPMLGRATSRRRRPCSPYSADARAVSTGSIVLQQTRVHKDVCVAQACHKPCVWQQTRYLSELGGCKNP
jgi:hypothetical protein